MWSLISAGAPAVALVAVSLAFGCSERPSFEPGDECELNTQCAATLVCRLGRCRVECRAQRDCPVTLECVRDADGFGACQLPDEASCSLTSECPQPLVCRFTRCTNPCESDIDCPPGSRCVADDDGDLGCRDQAGRECTLNSECRDMDLICAPDGHCREPCQSDRDCRDGTVCDIARTPTACVFPEDRTDAGTDGGGDPDGGADAGVDGGSDAGPDAGSMVMGTPPPPSMAGGEAHACASPAGIGLHCWGHNDFGQIGTAGMTVEPFPDPVALTGVTVTGAGARHSCAIHGGGVSCWGSNTDGQLGLGSAGGTRATPVAVGGLPGAATDLALGAAHTCVIDSGRLFCFGANSSGQLGNGSTTPSPAPAEVTLPSTPLEVASFGSHTCVLLADARVFCFGENGSGEAGDGSAGADRLSPGPVAGLGASFHVATGTTHSCAIEAGGGVKCWGNGLLGQRGDGSGGPPVSGTAVATALAVPARQLALGSTHSCAVTASALYCWGDNASGQAGQPRTTFSFDEPTEVTSVGAVDEVAAGTNHTCARDGTRVRCWGDNGFGQLGDGTTGSPDHLPRTVAFP